MDFTRISSLQINGRSVQRLDVNWRQVWTAEEDTTDYLTFTSQQFESTLKLTTTGSPDPIELEFRTGDEAGHYHRWETYSTEQDVVLMPRERVQFRGDNATFSKDNNNYYQFQMSGKFAASGSIMTLLDKKDELRVLPNNAFQNLFAGCSALTSTPELPATSIGNYAYYGLFRDCTELVSASELPLDSVGQMGCCRMFYNCPKLTQPPPRLEVNTVTGSDALRQMFALCTRMTNAPTIACSPTTTRAFYQMFDGCNRLNYIKVEFDAWPTGDDATLGWVNAVASSGTFVCPPTLPEIYSVAKIPPGWNVKWEPEPNYLTLTALENNSTIALNAVGTPDPIDLEYRTNHEDTWHPYTIGDTLSMMSGWTLELRGDNATFSLNGSSYYKFSMTGSYAASGSIMTLLDKTDTLRTLPSNAFNRLFLNCSQMTTPPELPATTMGEACYDSTFSGCSSMTVAPELPATTLAKQCFSAMFQNCSSITQAPELPVTELKELCYNSMYEGCTNLTTPPELPATTVLQRVYSYMFHNCTSLTAAPELPATTLANDSYEYMFAGCTNLNYINVKFTGWHSNATGNWVSGVPASGTFICPATLPEERSRSRIPTGWTRQDVA